jgi:predicted secreted protein
MTVTGSIAVYFVIWWTVLFVMLPFGVRSQAEMGDVTAGTDPGAPVMPGLRTKALWTTLIAGIVFAGLFAAWPYIGF